MMMMPFIYLFLQKQKLAYPIYPVGTVDEETTNPEQGPGGDVERFAAQLVYDSAFALIVRSKSIQDSESVREVLWREREGKRGHTERGGRERERERAWSLNPLLLSIFFLIILLYYY